MRLPGIPFFRYLDVDDSEQVLSAVRLTPEDRPVHLVLYIAGRLVWAAKHIAQGSMHHEAKAIVFIPHYAMSGGTLLALAADEIVLDRTAPSGVVDPRVRRYPARLHLGVARERRHHQIDHGTVSLADLAER